jgi:hypothetical protein
MNPKRKRTVAVLALMGSILFVVGVYLCSVRIMFLVGARSFQAPVVAIMHESVPKGRGSVLAYVPTVEVPDFQGRPLKLKVDTFNEEPVYSIGQKMRVVCNPDRGCIEDTFVARWGDGLIDLILALVFFAPLLYYKVVPDARDAKAKLLPLRPDA